LPDRKKQYRIPDFCLEGFQKTGCHVIKRRIKKGGIPMNKQEKLKELKEKLEELKGRDPSHCSGTEGFVGHTGHSMSPELFQQIEALEEEIKKLKKELK
jgi:hypothetical protein